MGVAPIGSSRIWLTDVRPSNSPDLSRAIPATLGGRRSWESKTRGLGPPLGRGRHPGT